MSMLFNQGSDLVYHSDNNSEALLDLNTAIKALYAIEAGALSANIDGDPKDNFMRYCPSCGTKMDGGDEDG